MTITNYLTALEQSLRQAKVPARQRKVVLAENRSLLAELTDLEAELGSPAEYAAAVMAELDTDGISANDSRWVFAGVPVDLTGVFRPEAYRRIFDPADNRILLPRLCGLGWTVNLGAIAVKCGLIRPDDIDADVVAAIPQELKQGLTAVPYALSAVNLLLLARYWRVLPEKVHSNWTLGGQPRGNPSSKKSLIPFLIFNGCGAVIAARKGPEPVGAATGTVLASTALGQTWAVINAARGKNHPGLATIAGMAVGAIAAVAMIVVPMHTGLHRVWQQQGVRH